MDKSLLDEIIREEESLRRQIEAEKKNVRESLDIQQEELENKFNLHISKLKKRYEDDTRRRIKELNSKQERLAAKTDETNAEMQSVGDNAILSSLTELFQERFIGKAHDHQDVES